MDKNEKKYIEDNYLFCFKTEINEIGGNKTQVDITLQKGHLGLKLQTPDLDDADGSKAKLCCLLANDIVKAMNVLSCAVLSGED